MATVDVVDLWSEGDNRFEEDPPNAVLAFFEPGDEAPEDAVVVIQDPRLETAISATRSSRLRAPVFIDPVGRPLSPVCACGVRRRERRRARRRISGAVPRDVRFPTKAGLASQMRRALVFAPHAGVPKRRSD
jgi:hypothetical protein